MNMSKALLIDTIVKMDVVCEKCQTAFHPPLEVKVSENYNPEKEGNEDRARKKLDETFAERMAEDGIVKCPSC